MPDDPTVTPLIRCRNLWKLFGEAPERWLADQPGVPDFESIRDAGYIPAVRDVSLDIAPGEMLVIMGLSGSGKSTLLRCLSRLIESTAGAIDVDGQDLRALDARGLIELRRRKMGMVFQNFALLPNRTVLDNVAFPLQMRGQDRHARRERALEVIELVGLAGREDYFPRELSGGQQQRVGIARSLAIEPDIWFLDEPFSALDPLIRREMQDEFVRLQAMLGKTIVFTIPIGPFAITATGRIEALISDEDHYGFVYSTLDHHPFVGTEAIILDKSSGQSMLTISTVWRPNCLATRLTGPFATAILGRIKARYLNGIAAADTAAIGARMMDVVTDTSKRRYMISRDSIRSEAALSLPALSEDAEMVKTQPLSQFEALFATPFESDAADSSSTPAEPQNEIPEALR